MDCGLVVELESYVKAHNVSKDIRFPWLSAFYSETTETVFEKAFVVVLKEFKKVQETPNFDLQAHGLF